MTKIGQYSATSTSSISGEWLPTADLPKRIVPTDTRGVSNDGVVMLQGRLLADGETTHVAVTVDPATIDRKLAIRKLNDQLDGRSPPPDTFVNLTARR